MADDEDIPAARDAGEPAAPAKAPPPTPRAPVATRFGPPLVRETWPRKLRRHLPPLAGLALFVGCLWGSFMGSTLPAWRPWWLGGHAAPNPGNVAVVIDPGHGGGDSGAVAHGMVEKDLNLDVGLRVARVLRAQGVAVQLTREDDHFVSLENRVRQANALPGAIFVSIHFNDASGGGQAVNRASGIETFYSENKEAVPPGWTWTSLLGAPANAGTPGDNGTARAVREGEALADAIQGSLINGTAATDRGIKERGLYVTRRVLGPAVLVEGGFVSHPAEARLLGDPAYRQKLADSVASGILHYLEMARRPPNPNTPAIAAAHPASGG